MHVDEFNLIYRIRISALNFINLSANLKTLSLFSQQTPTHTHIVELYAQLNFFVICQFFS